MPLRTSAWGPRKACRFVGRGALRERCPAPAKGRSRAWRTFGRRGVAIRFPRRETWQVGSTSGEFVTPYEFARSTTFCHALPQEYGLPRRFAPRNDSGGGVIAPQCLAPADTRHVSAHLAHQTFLHPLTRLCLQHVIANQCAHWCGNPHPRRETWQTGTTLGKFVVLFRICPRRCFPLCCAARRTDCHVASLLAMTCRNLPPVRACNYALPAKPAAAYEFA